LGARDFDVKSGSDSGYGFPKRLNLTLLLSLGKTVDPAVLQVPEEAQ
jgi:hypothetical protein